MWCVRLKSFRRNKRCSVSLTFSAAINFWHLKIASRDKGVAAASRPQMCLLQLCVQSFKSSLQIGSTRPESDVVPFCIKNQPVASQDGPSLWHVAADSLTQIRYPRSHALAPGSSLQINSTLDTPECTHSPTHMLRLLCFKLADEGIMSCFSDLFCLITGASKTKQQTRMCFNSSALEVSLSFPASGSSPKCDQPFLL